MEKSLKQSLDTAITAIEQASSTQTSFAGSKTVATKSTTKLERSRQNNMADPTRIEGMTQTKLFQSRYQIRKEGTQEQKSELKDHILECLTPATYGECVYFILRMMNHFPQRNVTKDAIVSADIAAELAARKESVVAVCMACKELWMKSSTDNPFPPPSGTILDLCAEKTKSLKDFYDYLCTPVLPMIAAPKKEIKKPSWEGGKWLEWDDKTKREFVAAHRTWERTFFKHVERIYGVTYDEMINYGLELNFFA